MDYFEKKELNKNRAQQHTRLMDEQFPEKIAEETAGTIVYGGPNKKPENVKRERKAPEWEVVRSTSDSAIFTQDENAKVAVLNFASYKNPGGMFYEGSSAQEESLCHVSTLYNILRNFSGTYYAWNNEHKNRALYTDRALYTPDVIFEQYFRPGMNLMRLCDVITCAAPNIGAAKRWQNVSDEENTRALKQRIEFLKAIAEENGVEALILGAWGTGVFKQSPEEVAQLFKEVFAETTVKKIVHPIPDEKTFNVFARVYGQK